MSSRTPPPCSAREWSPPVRALLTQQVADAVAEREARAAMPALTPILDDSLGAGAPAIRGKSLSALGQLRADRPASRASSTICAASFRRLRCRTCAPGRHRSPRSPAAAPASTPSRPRGGFPAARVLAIDLSLASLGYARARRRTLGVDESRLRAGRHPATRLARPPLRRDRVERRAASSGRSVRGLAQPADAAAARRLHAWSGSTASWRAPTRAACGPSSPSAATAHAATDIRRSRQDMHGVRGDPAAARDAWIGDFFSVSGCRDLLFHVQEHRLTLPQIKGFLAEQRSAISSASRSTRPPAAAIARRFPTDAP